MLPKHNLESRFPKHSSQHVWENTHAEIPQLCKSMCVDPSKSGKLFFYRKISWGLTGLCLFIKKPRCNIPTKQNETCQLRGPRFTNKSVGFFVLVSSGLTEASGICRSLKSQPRMAWTITVALMGSQCKWQKSTWGQFHKYIDLPYLTFTLPVD